MVMLMFYLLFVVVGCEFTLGDASGLRRYLNGALDLRRKGRR